MNRRRILALLAGSGAALSSRYASAADRNSGSTTAAKPGPARRGGIAPGSSLPDLKLLGPSHQVLSIGYSRGAYSVMTADGKSAFFLESDLRFKVDSSELGPDDGKPVITPAGTEGDRAWVLFSSPHEIGGFIEHRRS
jgi:hypothetical protein